MSLNSDQPITKEYISQFLQENHLGVLSTVNSSGLPDAAPIYFITHAGYQLIFITPLGSRKHINIIDKNDVLVTIVNTNRTETVQVRGKAVETKELVVDTLGKLARALNYGADFLTNLPLLKYEKQEKTAFKIVPSEVRIRRYTEHAFIEKILHQADLVTTT